MDQKLPPYSLEAEQSVLGALMLQNEAWDKIAGMLSEGDFYRKDHRLIFRAIATLAEKDEPRDVLTLHEWLQCQGVGEDAGGLAYLGTMANETGSAANIVAYARVVRDRAVMRELIGVGAAIADLGYLPAGREAAELVGEAEALLGKLTDGGPGKSDDPVTMRQALRRVVDTLDAAYHGGGSAGESFGLSDLDAATGGMHPGDLIIVAGRPSMGKTALAFNVAERMAMRHEDPKAVLVFSLEMPAEQLALRSLAGASRVPVERLRSGDLTDEDWNSIPSAVTLGANALIEIDDWSEAPAQIRAQARRWRRRCRANGQTPGLIVVDYLQLMQVPGSKENRVNVLAECSRALKKSAKEVGVPVIALSQLSRQCENRPDKRPRMADIRDSGAIEQDADLILGVYREEAYEPEDPAAQGLAELICMKNRNGSKRTVDVAFRGEFTRFEDLHDMGKQQARALRDRAKGGGQQRSGKSKWARGMDAVNEH